MSKVCKQCGSIIPDEADVCPSCGGKEYTEEAFEDVLNKILLSVDNDDQDQPAPEDLEFPADTEEVEEIVEESVEFPDPEEAPAPKPSRKKRPDQPKKDRPAGQRPQAEPHKGDKKPRKVRPAELEDDEYDDDYQERKPMKKRSAAVIGVLIGLFVALLLIAAVGGYMLYQLGFLSPASDDELLGTAQTAAPSASPTPTPVILEGTQPTPSAQASQSPESSPAASGESAAAVQVDSFTLTSDSELTFSARGETSKIEYTIAPETAESAIEWSSDNELVATVDEYGTIQARRGGTCVITGKAGSKSVKIDVTCDFTVPETVLDMNYEDITLSYEGQTVQLAIDYDLSPEYEKATVWESSDPAVATVDTSGMVTAVADGTAVVTASIADYTASCIVRCSGVTGNAGYNSPKSEYVINYEDVTLTRKGEYFQLTIKSVLNGGEVPDFIWTSDDPSVATVDDKGVVTAISDGVAYITAKVGEDQFRCIVRVSIS